jgi:hypothetical protein
MLSMLLSNLSAHARPCAHSGTTAHRCLCLRFALTAPYLDPCAPLILLTTGTVVR